MGSPTPYYHLVPIVVCFLTPGCEARLERERFPDDFLFGAGSSAYQWEGAANAYGRGPSIWDTFTSTFPEKIADRSSGAMADEVYFRYKEDIAMLKEIGFNSFRFSISWPRVLPRGKLSGGVNQEGVQFYNNFINNLLSNGLKPLITLFHWDIPQALEDEYGGFLSPKIVNDFRDYADFCFKEFGDRVKFWITINEPNFFAIGGYETGTKAPGRCSRYIGNCTFGNSATEPYLVVHHMVLAHATATKLYKDKYQASQKGIIGISAASHWFVPKYQKFDDYMAASRALDFMFGWIVDPIMLGDYPETMKSLVASRLPKFTKEQSKLIKGSIDFLGANYYTAMYAEDDSDSYNVDQTYSTDSKVNLTSEKDGIPIGEPTSSSWLYAYPKGIEDFTMYIKTKYNNPPTYITENGVADQNLDLTLINSLNDTLRIKYHQQHLSHLLVAIKAGADVRGYYAWSFLDDFEWDAGYTIRFGLVYIDYKNMLRRYKKESAKWFQKFLQKRNIIGNNSSSFIL